MENQTIASREQIIEMLNQKLELKRLQAELAELCAKIAIYQKQEVEALAQLAQYKPESE